MKKAFLYILTIMGYMATASAQVSIVDITTTDVTCNGGTNGSVTITVTGGQAPYVYTIQKGGADFHYSPPVADTFYTFSNVKANNWIALVEDVNEKADFDYALVEEPGPVTIVAETTVPITCTGDGDGEIQIAATGESGTYNFTLSPGGTSNTDGHFQSLGPGNYSVTVTDDGGCSSSDVSGTITLVDPNPISIVSETATPLNCNGSLDGKVTVTAAGGTGAYTYTLNPGALQTNSTGNFTALDQGIYTVDVTDVNGCPSATSNPITVTEPAAIQITSESKTDISCNGSADGTITITASGGNGPYLYALSPGSATTTDGQFTNLGAGTYSVSVTDANGCGPVVSNNMVINEPDPLVITSVNATDITCNNAGNGIVTVTSTGGSAPVTYTLNPVGTSNQTGIFNGL